MTISAQSVEDYYNKIPPQHKAAMEGLRRVIRENIPEGFAEALSYGAPGFVVPHSLYPSGYHCKPQEALPFITLMSQKHYIGLYHLGIYADAELLNWFQEEYPKHSPTRLDMGKSCIRFKKMDDIPYALISELASRMSVQQWLSIYEARIKK